MASLKIELLDENEPTTLFCHYRNEMNPQRVYIELHQDGTCQMDYDGEIGGGVPFDVWHGRTRRYYLPACPTAARGNELLEELRPLLERVAAGLDEEWDNHNWIGTLTADAERAEEEIVNAIESTYVEDPEWLSEWDVSEWMHDWDETIGGQPLTADTTDEAIKTEAKALTAVALYEGVVLYDVDDYIIAKRDALRNPEDDED